MVHVGVFLCEPVGNQSLLNGCKADIGNVGSCSVADVLFSIRSPHKPYVSDKELSDEQICEFSVVKELGCARAIKTVREVHCGFGIAIALLLVCTWGEELTIELVLSVDHVIHFDHSFTKVRSNEIGDNSIQ